MGLFGKKNKDKQEHESKSGMVEKIGTNSEELQDLLKEFKEMRAGIKEPEEETEEILEDVEGEEYELPEEDSESIENFLNGKEDVEEEIIEDEVDDDLEEIEKEVPVEEIIDEEPEEEVLSESSLEEVEEEVLDFEEPVEEEVASEVEEPEVEDEILDEPAIELQEETLEEEGSVEEVEFSEVEEPVEEEIKEDVTGVEEEESVIEDLASEPQEEEIAEEVVEEEVEPEEKTQGDVARVGASEGVSAEELDQKFNDFEKRLLDKIMQQFMAVQSNNVEVKKQPKVVEVTPVSSTETDELEISTKDGHLVINGYNFTGEVVMFTPLESLKKATWEEVVRRKGHCTYHLTTSGNGGWFIKKSNAPNPYAYIENKEDAEALAKIYAQREKAELKIHNAKGVIEKSLSFGREKLRG